MLISRIERISLPNTEEGILMANQYADDMRNAGMDVNVGLESTGCISVYGHFVGELDDSVIAKLVKE